MDHEGENYLVNYSELLLKPKFSAAPWTIAAIRPQALVLAPLETLKGIFAPVIALSMIAALLLALTQIRRNLVPLEQLIQGTRRIANRDFGNPVTVTSGDEFEQLGASFNLMATHLDKQFQALTTLAEIDQVILTTLDVDRVLVIIVQRLVSIVPCDFLSVIVPDSDSSDRARCYLGAAGDEPLLQRIELSPEQQSALLSASDGLTLDLRHSSPSYVRPLERLGAQFCFVMPILWKGTLSGVLALGYRTQPEFSPDDVHRLRDFGGRVAVALSSAAREEELYHQARYDLLTGLPNRLLFRDRLTQELARADREKSKLALLFIDLDRFKSINDSLGHGVGDKLLKQAAERLKHSLREADTLARLGGDEFTAILNTISSPSDAGVVAEHLIAALSKAFFIDHHECFVGASIGVAIYPGDAQNADDLLKNADTAMYRAKQSGRGRHEFFTERMNIEAQYRVGLERELRHALERGELVLHFHPQFDLRSGLISGVEALVRWQHPERGLLAPEKFIAIAEESGLIDPIGTYVLNTACAQFQAWRAEGIVLPRMAVNVSGHQFAQKHFLRTVRAALEQTGMPPLCLELEITESLLMDDTEEVIAMLQNLHDMGLRLAIDDFGTGYSSMAYLKRLPLDILKIDRTFIRDITVDQDSAAITRAIIAMAHSLRKEVVAEGIETQEQAAFLRTERCEHGQGYYFSKPIPAAAMECLARTHHSDRAHGVFG